MTVRSLIAFLLACGTCLASTAASADPTPQDKALAQSLFREGRTLLVAGKTAEACSKLVESDKLDPELGTHLNVAICHETLGKTASAWVEFGEVADRAERTRDTDRLRFARQHAQDLDKKLSRVRVSTPNAPADLVVEIDGATIGRAALDSAIPLDPGSHELRASAHGKTAAVQRFDVPAGPSTIDVAVPPLQDAPVAPLTPTDRKSVV